MNRELLQTALDTALHLGAADAEALLIRDTTFEVEVSRGQVETLAVAESIGIGARVLTHDHRMGFAYAALPSLATCGERLAWLMDAAWQNACINAPDPHNVLPDGSVVSESDWSQDRFANISAQDKVSFCRNLEAKTLAADTRVEHVDSASYGDSRLEYIIANTRGVFRRHQTASGSCSVVAAAASPGADSEMGWEFDVAPRFDALRLDWVAERAATRAVQALGAKPCATRTMPVVLDNAVAASFVGVIGPALMASNVLKGKSLFADRIGDGIASEHVTLIDRNDLESGLQRFPFDSEGVSAQETILVSRGSLKGFLHNAYTAHRMGAAHTANASRGGGFRSAPEVGPSNAYLSPGSHTQDGLCVLAGDGLFVTDAMGVHTADPVSGDFSFGASGLMIEHGRRAWPVRGVTIAGNVKDVLAAIAAVGNDLRFFGAYGAPSLLVSGLTVSGT